jgi:murein DD-endopeptidase MepM/ murein hydrolase activator NlpD
VFTKGPAAESLVDSGVGAVLESPNPETLARPGSGGVAGANPGRKHNRLSRRSQFSLLIVRGDGSRVIRFNFVRPTAVSAGVALAVMVSLTGALVGDWVHLRELNRDAATFHTQIAEQRATIDAFNGRVTELRKEMSGWRDLHAKIWEPFGPEMSPGGKDRGIGGGTPAKDPTPAKLSPVDELNRLGEAVKEQTQRLTALERLMTRAGKAVAALPSRWPVRGAVNSEFGTRNSPWTSGIEFHSGLDIRAERGTAIYAPANGSVVLAGNHQEYGNAIILDHGQDVRSLYGHLSRLNVQPGQRVERGGLIGWTGNTGRSSGPHLHYEILVRGQAVNPRAYLWD